MSNTTAHLLPRSSASNLERSREERLKILERERALFSESRNGHLGHLERPGSACGHRSYGLDGRGEEKGAHRYFGSGVGNGRVDARSIRDALDFDDQTGTSTTTFEDDVSRGLHGPLTSSGRPRRCSADDGEESHTRSPSNTQTRSYLSSGLRNLHTTTTPSKRWEDEDRKSNLFSKRWEEDDRKNTFISKRWEDEDRKSNTFSKRWEDDDRKNTFISKRWEDDDGKPHSVTKAWEDFDRGRARFTPSSPLKRAPLSSSRRERSKSVEKRVPLTSAIRGRSKSVDKERGKRGTSVDAWRKATCKDTTSKSKYTGPDKSLLALLEDERQRYSSLEADYHKLLKEVQALQSSHQQELRNAERKHDAGNKSLQKELALKTSEHAQVLKELERWKSKYSADSGSWAAYKERHERTVQDLAKVRKQLSEAIATKDEDSRKLANLLKNKELECAREKDGRKRLEEQMSRLETRLTQREEEIQNLKSSLHKKQRDDEGETAKFRHEFTEARREIDQLIKREKQYLREIEESATRERKLASDLEELSSQQQKYEEEIERLTNRNTVYLQDIEHLKCVETSVREELQNLVTRHSKKMEEMAQLDTASRRQHAETHRLEKDLSELRTLAGDLRTQNDRLNNELAHHRITSQKLQAENTDLISQRDSLSHSVHETKQQNTHLLQRIDDLSRRLEESFSHKTNFETQKEENHSRLLVVADKIATLQKELGEAKTQIQKFQHAESVLSELLAERDKSIGGYERRMGEMENVISSLKQELEGERQQIDAFKMRKKEEILGVREEFGRVRGLLETEIMSLRSALAEKNGLIERLTGELERLKAVVHSQQQSQSHQESLRGALEEKNEVVERLRWELERLWRQQQESVTKHLGEMEGLRNALTQKTGETVQLRDGVGRLENEIRVLRGVLGEREKEVRRLAEEVGLWRAAASGGGKDVDRVVEALQGSVGELGERVRRGVEGLLGSVEGVGGRGSDMRVNDATTVPNTIPDTTPIPLPDMLVNDPITDTELAKLQEGFDELRRDVEQRVGLLNGGGEGGVEVSIGELNVGGSREGGKAFGNGDVIQKGSAQHFESMPISTQQYNGTGGSNTNINSTQHLGSMPISTQQYNGTGEQHLGSDAIRTSQHSVNSTGNIMSSTNNLTTPHVGSTNTLSQTSPSRQTETDVQQQTRHLATTTSSATTNIHNLPTSPLFQYDGLNEGIISGGSRFGLNFGLGSETGLNSNNNVYMVPTSNTTTTTTTTTDTDTTTETPTESRYQTPQTASIYRSETPLSHAEIIDRAISNVQNFGLGYGGVNEAVIGAGSQMNLASNSNSNTNLAPSNVESRDTPDNCDTHHPSTPSNTPGVMTPAPFGENRYITTTGRQWKGSVGGLPRGLGKSLEVLGRSESRERLGLGMGRGRVVSEELLNSGAGVEVELD